MAPQVGAYAVARSSIKQAAGTDSCEESYSRSFEADIGVIFHGQRRLRQARAHRRPKLTLMSYSRTSPDPV